MQTGESAVQIDQSRVMTPVQTFEPRVGLLYSFNILMISDDRQ